MPVVDLHHLIARLSAECRVSLEAAAAAAVRNSHDSVELAHWMQALGETAAFRDVLDAVGVPADGYRRETAAAVADLRRGQGGTPAFSPTLVLLAREAWVSASLQHNRPRILAGDLLAAMTAEASLRSLSRAVAPSLREASAAGLETWLAEAGRTAEAAPEPGRHSVETGQRQGAPGPTEDFLRLYTQDMTADARAGRIDRVVGRDDELRQVIDILLRRRQNNPILVGEAGVGKTAVAEAFALAIEAGALPEKLKGTRLLRLDLSLLQAGAGVKGEFERRLTGVVDAVKASALPIILFIDEAHGLVGAGNQPGQGDAANILKPALARGELRTIAATTWSEYKRHIERDPALTRRFQTVAVGEPDEAAAVRMLRGVVDLFQAHHGVRIRDEALAAAVRLSARYIPARQLPDKAVSLIDTAASSVAFGRESEPAALASLSREIELLATEAARLAREPRTEAIEARLAAIAARRASIETESAALRERFETERALAADADALEARVEADSSDAAARRELAAVEAKFAKAVRNGEPLVHRVVDAEAIAALVSRWTGVPVGRLLADGIATVNTLAGRLGERVVGQPHALGVLAEAMRVSRAGLADPRRPPGVFLMVGTSGVGKTETALALADLLYGGPQHLTVINMSEFKEEHKVSTLLGSPPGYVGFGEGGVLTEAVRRRPYGVLLLDEIDKAHPGVQDIFYQLFDKGSLRDGEGRDIDFRNTTVLMTANTGSEVLEALAADPDTMPGADALPALLQDALLAQFKPAFLGRTTLLPFLPLGREAFEAIAAIQIGRLAERVSTAYAGCALQVSGAARAHLAEGAALDHTGARAIEGLVSRELLPALSTHFLEAMLDGRTPKAVAVDHAGDTGFTVADAPLPARSHPHSPRGSRRRISPQAEATRKGVRQAVEPARQRLPS
ncbi:type VI secretion system ATPase TssH [Aureimonas leprariae]|uniref:Type VI secretion system ATPase TssH n=1 Tax=Plantimonas leprariae TaxID=2615207 RepID=A0A7V7TX28_9HYPH|nr:type VI secretion system ATPase TssH [Aureimonas leprariae]KAB0680245.1 type VI secretion system ATPase TssH [Aureimonas leprariae]